VKHAIWMLLGCMCLAAAGCSGTAERDASVDPAVAPSKNTKVGVIYMHRTLRCVSCLVIEKMASETVHDDFGGKLADGTVDWQTMDFWARKDLAQRYGVDAPTVVVITYAEGREKSFQRLDPLWDLKLQPEKFKEVVKAAVNKALQEAK
jgi:ABC-type glycerol-3-phosphate transport system substrate-binding protein